MTKTKTAAVILAAGLGTRMKSAVPKVLHPLAGRPMLLYLLETIAPLGFDPVVVVTGKGMNAVAETAKPHPIVIQEPALGTGHAVLAAKEVLGEFSGDVLVLFGADPLITPETITRLLAARQGKPEPAVVALGFEATEPGDYGRLILSGDGSLQAIVEARDATPEQLEICLCNSGVMAIDGQHLWRLLDRVGDDNAKGEYYLTDIVALAREDGLHCAVVEGIEEELIGIDSRADLAMAEMILQDRLRQAAMDGGATLLDPDSVTFCFDTRLGRDVTIGPHVHFGPGVGVGDGVEILPFCHIEGAEIAPGARIGPFARLRPGADIAEDVHIGNFVEIKNAAIEAGAKVNHLTYVGDARVGTMANVGAGTITCNYDGFQKHHTDIGAGAFIGSNTALVAPVKIGPGATVGAGSVITKDVDADAIAITRAPQKQTKGGAKRMKARKGKKKGGK
ncbi:MAG: bifunctional N-acetylglucosamine-1-phosphate uridyltransferase/glucosamine-1-phosphate acetyltransferase [Rhodospirillaceae bacterium]|nr:bifunctional N-acetylglucosamine-1-phosphate uridyltransferase/glucosamine-1-phosphate acetyltransferase [Rhodospirillaceae bacterium]